MALNNPELVTSNDFLKIVAGGIVTYLNKNGVLKLYTNQPPPDPANNLASFAEAFFGGYKAVLLTGAFENATRGADGEYISACPDFRFECDALPEQTVFGWYIQAGSLVVLSSPLLVPIRMNVGTTFTLSVIQQTWATFSFTP